MSLARDPYDPARTATINGWQQHAACKTTPAEHVTRAHCGACPVTRNCGKWVIQLTNIDDPGGLIAGMSPDERGQVRRELARRRAANLKKRCTRCGEVKAGREFYARPDATTGIESSCLECKRADNRKSAALRRLRERQARTAGKKAA